MCIKVAADNRVIDRRQVYSQLMGAASHWDQSQPCATRPSSHEFIPGEGSLASFKVNDLPRSPLPSFGDSVLNSLGVPEIHPD